MRQPLLQRKHETVPAKMQYTIQYISLSVGDKAAKLLEIELTFLKSLTVNSAGETTHPDHWKYHYI